MERRRLIAIGTEGPVPDLPEGSGGLWVPVEKNRGAVVFGLPKRSEDDAERALRLAHQLSSPSHRMIIQEIDANIEEGEPKLDWSKNFQKNLGTIKTGDVLVAPALAKIYDRLFLFEEVEEEEHELFFLRGVRHRPTRLRGLKPTHAPLVGRLIEIKRLKELIEQIAVDQGQIAAIVGEAGIGKTRLVVALKELAKDQSIPLVEGSYTLGETLQPYRAFQEIVRQLTSGNIETLTRWKMEEVEVDFLRLLLEPDQKIERFSRLSEEELRQGLFHATRKLIHGAAKTPLIVIIEDLHWADNRSLELLEHLLEGMENTKLLLALVYRPTLQLTCQKRLNFNELRLEAMEKGEVNDFVEKALGVDRIAAKVRDELVRLSQGNPLFVEEMLRQLLDADTYSIEPDEQGKNVLRAKTDGGKNIPTTLHSLIASRFDALEDRAREVLRWAVFLGSTFGSKEIINLLVEREITNSHETLEKLIENNYLFEKSVFPERVYAFRHDLIYEVIRESLSKGEHKRRHEEVGLFLESFYQGHTSIPRNRIADHFLQSDNHKKAIDWAEKAGRHFSELYAYPLAKSYYQRGLEVWCKSPERNQGLGNQLYEQSIRMLVACGDLKSAIHTLKEWGENGIFSTPKENIEFNLLAAETYRAINDPERVLEFSEQAIVLAKGSPEFEEEYFQAIVIRNRAMIYLKRNNDAVHEALKNLRRIGDSRYPLIRFQLWTGLARRAGTLGALDQALDYLEKAKKIPSHFIPPGERIEFEYQSAVISREALELEKCFAHCQEAIRIATESGMKARALVSLEELMFTYTDFGFYQKALETGESGLKLAHELEHRTATGRFHVYLTDCHFDMGSFEEGARKLTWLKENQQTVPDTWAETQLHVLTANPLFYEGAWDRASEALAKASGAYEKLDNRTAAKRLHSRAISLAALHDLKKKDEIGADFTHILATMANVSDKKTRAQLWTTSLDLLSIGIDVPTPKLDEFELRTLNPVWMRFPAYVAKIRYLRSVAKDKEAEALIKEHGEAMQEVAQNVPKEYREMFLAHPMYVVPNNLL